MKNNKGFSLVELIIVIAIMAILVGLIAPQLIKYMEKSAVAADQGTLNSVYAAVTYAVMDPAVQEDPASKAVIDNMINPMKLQDIPTDTVLYKEIISSIGWPDLSQANYVGNLSSSHTSSSEIIFQYKGSFFNPIAMWITHTDSTGMRDTSEAPATYGDIEKCISIK